MEKLPPEGLTRLPPTVWRFLWFFMRQIRTRFLILCLLGIVVVNPHFLIQL